MGNWITALGIPEVFEGLVCCATSASSAACSKCSVGHPRFVFSLFFLFATMASFLVLSPHSRQLLGKIPYFCTAVTTNEMCDNLVGYGAVYRICFSLSAFHIIFAVIMLNTTSTNDFRCKLHNGYWLVKLVLLVLILVGAFHIPKHAGFARVWMYVGLTGGFMFIIIQILLVIDFAHSWSVAWADRVDSGNTNFWYAALALSTILIYSVAITMVVLFYLFFTDLRDLTKCRGNMFLITFNLSHCLLASFISVLPQVQEEAVGSGLLQSSVVTLYAMYLTWCTLSSEPGASCNPLGDVILEYDKASGVNGQAVFDCVLMFALLIFACNVRPGTSKLEDLGFSLSKMIVPKKYDYIDNLDESSPNNSRDKNVDGDEFVEYNYSYFHFVMFLASLQLMMVVTNWHSPEESSHMKKLVKNWATVWIQLSASFLCVLFYIWAMVLPLFVTTWGSCLGLDYARVPTEDEECGRSRKRNDVMYGHGDIREEFSARTNFRKTKVDKSRQSTMDSGMFDTNATRSYSRSVSRASIRQKATNSEVFGTSGLGPSEDTGDTVLDTASISLDQKDENEELRKEKLQQLQSKEPAVKGRCSEAGIYDASQSRSTNIKDVNEIGGTSAVFLQGRKSAIEIDVTIGNLSGKESKHSRPSSRIVVNDRALTSDEESSNRLRRTNGISSDEERECSRVSEKSNPCDLSLSLEGEKVTGRARIKSSEEKNDSQRVIDSCPSKMSDGRTSARPPSRSNGGDRLISSDERNKHSRPCSRASETSRSRLSDGDASVRLTSSLVVDDQLISSDKRDKRFRLKLSSAKNHCLGSSSEGLANARNASSDESLNHQSPSSRPAENTRTSEKGHPVLLKMKQHIEWMKRLRTSHATAWTNWRGGNISENKQKSEENNVKTSLQVSPLDKMDVNVREGDGLNEETLNKSINDSSKRKENVLENRQKSEENNETLQVSSLNNMEEKVRMDDALKDRVLSEKEDMDCEKTSESFVMISAVEDPNETSRKKRHSAIVKHPFVSEHFSNFSKTEPHVQPPEVSREILRIQAKILKFQARVVKMQQKIIGIQVAKDTANERTRSPSDNST